MIFPRLAVALTVALLPLTALPAFAQRKPDPEPINQMEEKAPDIALFTSAYQAAGEPRVLVLCGIDSRSYQLPLAEIEASAVRVRATEAAVVTRHAAGAAVSVEVERDKEGLAKAVKHIEGLTEGAEQTATGQVSAQRYVGKNLGLFDITGDSTKLQADLEEILLQNHDLELVSLDALAESDRRDIQLLGLRDQKQAIQILGSKLNADLVLVIRMLPLPRSLQQGRDANYRVTVETLQIARGRKIAGFSFDWKLDAQSLTVKRYAEQIARKFIEQFASWFAQSPAGTPLRYSVRLVGLTNVAQLVKARTAFATIPGVSKVKDNGFTAGRESSVSALDVSFAGSLLDLVYQLQEMAGRELGMKVEASDAAAGAITLIASGPVDLAAEPDHQQRARALGNKDDMDHERYRKELRSAYAAQGSPRIGIVFSRELSGQELANPQLAQQVQQLEEQGKGGGVYVAIQTAGRDVNNGAADGAAGDAAAQQERAYQRLLEGRLIEDALYKRMLELGLTMVDPAFVGQKVGEAAKDRQVFAGDEAALLLGKAAGLDIVIHGVSRVERNAAGVAQGVSYSVRAVRLNDGVTLGAEGASADAVADAAATAGRIAEQIAGSLGDQMMSTWDPPQMLQVRLHGASTQKDVLAIMTALQQNVGGITGADFDRLESGDKEKVGYFTLRYTGSHEELTKKISDLQGKLPFQLEDAGGDRQVLHLKVKKA